MDTWPSHLYVILKPHHRSFTLTNTLWPLQTIVSLQLRWHLVFTHEAHSWGWLQFCTVRCHILLTSCSLLLDKMHTYFHWICPMCCLIWQITRDFLHVCEGFFIYLFRWPGCQNKCTPKRTRKHQHRPLHRVPLAWCDFCLLFRALMDFKWTHRYLNPGCTGVLYTSHRSCF